MIHLLEKYHKDLNAIESPTNTSSALVETYLLREVDATETESPINTSSTLVETYLLREVDATETESPINTSSALVENDLLPEANTTETESPASMSSGTVVSDFDCIISDSEINDVDNDPTWVLTSEDQSDSNSMEVDNDDGDMSIVYGPILKRVTTTSAKESSGTLTCIMEKRETATSAKESLGTPIMKAGVEISKKESVENKEFVQPFQRNLSPEECSFDPQNEMLFIKCYKNNVNKENSKHGRTYDTVQACYYCSRLFTNLQTHLEKKHKKEEEIETILNLKIQKDEVQGKEKEQLSKEIQQLQDLIRHKGNNQHNERVQRAEQGEILLSRRKQTQDFQVDDYGPCPNCLEWVSLDLISKHFKTCPAEVKGLVKSKGAAIMESKNLKGKLVIGGSKKPRGDVFPSMTRDEITEIAQGDALICSLGDIWLMKNIDNKLRYKNSTSFRMRLVARLLQKMRNEAGKKSASMSDFFTVDNFETAVDCTIKLCEEDEHENLKNPSTAIKLGYDLQRLAILKENFGIKEKQPDIRTEGMEFLRFMKTEWSYKVSKLARRTLDERKFNKHTPLPNPMDIAKLASFLVTKIKQLNLEETGESVFRETAILTEARLLLHNRRRPGELESLRYVSRTIYMSLAIEV